MTENRSSAGRKTENEADSTNRVYQQVAEKSEVSNEFVLNVAFLSFLFFTIVQFFFAVLARSQSMMADCAAMSVDVISYFVNWCAERLKHGHSSLSPEQLRLKRLYLELIPPGISVITLIVVTVMALQLAIETLVDAYRGKNNGAPPPDVGLVLLFSGLNLGLDFFNVMFFAKADQAVGIPGQHGNEDIHVHFDSHHHPEHAIATEATPLVDSKSNGNTINPHDADTLSSRDSESVVETKGLNLNMCSAWTHVCADTLRSVAVLLAAGFSYLFPELLTPIEADSWGAVVVSLIILISLAPLLQGLYSTAMKIREVWINGNQSDAEIKHMIIEV